MYGIVNILGLFSKHQSRKSSWKRTSLHFMFLYNYVGITLFMRLHKTPQKVEQKGGDMIVKGSTCCSTTNRELTCPVGPNSGIWTVASSVFNGGGNPSRNLADNSRIASPTFFPAPPVLAFGWMPAMQSKILLLSWCWKVRLAFSCIPNKSGPSVVGKFWMYSTYEACGPSRGDL